MTDQSLEQVDDYLRRFRHSAIMSARTLPEHNNMNSMKYHTELEPEQFFKLLDNDEVDEWLIDNVGKFTVDWDFCYRNYSFERKEDFVKFTLTWT